MGVEKVLQEYRYRPNIERCSIYSYQASWNPAPTILHHNIMCCSHIISSDSPTLPHLFTLKTNVQSKKSFMQQVLIFLSQIDLVWFLFWVFLSPLNDIIQVFGLLNCILLHMLLLVRLYCSCLLSLIFVARCLIDLVASVPAPQQQLETNGVKYPFLLPESYYY